MQSFLERSVASGLDGKTHIWLQRLNVRGIESIAVFDPACVNEIGV